MNVISFPKVTETASGDMTQEELETLCRLHADEMLEIMEKLKLARDLCEEVNLAVSDMRERIRGKTRSFR